MCLYLGLEIKVQNSCFCLLINTHSKSNGEVLTQDDHGSKTRLTIYLERQYFNKKINKYSLISLEEDL